MRSRNRPFEVEIKRARRPRASQTPQEPTATGVEPIGQRAAVVAGLKEFAASAVEGEVSVQERAALIAEAEKLFSGRPRPPAPQGDPERSREIATPRILPSLPTQDGPPQVWQRHLRRKPRKAKPPVASPLEGDEVPIPDIADRREALSSASNADTLGLRRSPWRGRSGRGGDEWPRGSRWKRRLPKAAQ